MWWRSRPGWRLAPRPAPSYDPALHTLAERDAARAADLTAAGTLISAGTVKRMRLRYRAEGLWGLVDQRLVRSSSPFGRVDARVVAAVATAMQGETQRSTGTRGRLRRRVEQLLTAEHGAGVVPVPPSTKFYRLVAAMDAGRHTFGEATTRRTQANRPDRPFTRTFAVRPGEIVLWTTTATGHAACVPYRSGSRPYQANSWPATCEDSPMPTAPT